MRIEGFVFMGEMNLRKIEVIAHRGAPTEAPENTLVSFQRALEAGADWVEFDLRRTSEGRAIVFHDAALNRTTNGKGRVSRFSEEQLKKLDAGGWFGARFAGERIPTLDEALDWASGAGAMLHIEFKDSGIEEFTVKRTREHGMMERVVFSSFDFVSLRRVRELDPRARLAPIVIAYPKLRLLSQELAPEFVHLWSFYTLSRRIVDRAAIMRIDVNAWLVDSVPLLRRVATRGVRGVFTNEVALMCNLIKTTG